MKFAGGTALLASALASSAVAQTMNLTGLLSSTPELTNLTTALATLPQLLSSLTNATNITVLAPSNEAFTKFAQTPSGKAALSDIGGHMGVVKALLSYHVLNGTYPASKVTSRPLFLHSMCTDKMYSNVTGGQVVEAIQQKDKVLFYSGLLNNATVTKADVNFTGGVVHIIDTVLTLPVNVTDTASDLGLSATVGALTKGNVADIVDSLADVTVFAPTNEAFQNIGTSIRNASSMALADVSRYHVVNGSAPLYSTSLMNGTSAKTLGGQNVTITIENGTIYVNSAKVVIPNVLVSGGVVHVIDNVLNPGNSTARPAPSQSTQAPAFTGASSSDIGALTTGLTAPKTTVAPMAPTMATDANAMSSSSSGIAMPMRTAAVGMAAMFAGAGAWINV